MHESGQLETAKPTIEAYNLVLKCIDRSSSTSAELGQRAEAVLRDMQKHYQPTRESYKAVIYAMANTGCMDRAEALFEEMLAASNGSVYDDVKPDIGCFHAMLVACRKGRDAERAMSILRRFEQGWDDTGALDHVQLSAISYNLVLACLADFGMATESDNMLKRMQEKGVVPTIVSYNTVLNAWANSGHPESVARATKLVEEMPPFLSPNQRTYTIWLKIIAASSGPNKTSEFQRVLVLMKSDGFSSRRGLK